MAQIPLLQIEKVTKQFQKAEIPAVCEVSLTQAQGEILGLLGASGCGKTTLLRSIAGFESIQSGQISLAGRKVADAQTCVAPERRSIGMVFQDFALFPHLSVAENVAFGLKRGAAHPRVAQSIALVGLQGKESRYPHELSGGQQQRVALARALAPQPSLILLDEPLSNLDVQVRLYLRREVQSILKATGTTAIFVTHDQEEALSICDRVAVMRQGQIEQIGTPEQLYQAPASRFVAEFVTQANFLPAQRRSQVWETEIGCFAVADSHLAHTDSGELMIRQEDLQPEPHEAGVAVVNNRQFLGREYSYRLHTPLGQTLYARTPSRVLIPTGTRVKLSIDPQTLKLFPAPH